jgi:UDP-GlcNAc:undecaprenyl-phosphate GlcNAc-1-phosphate transferase
MWIVYGIGFVCALAISLMITPLVKRFALAVGAVDKPNERKVHTKLMPRLGGLAIYLGFMLGFFVVYPAIGGIDGKLVWGMIVGGSIIVLVGALDDRFDLAPGWKLLGQIAAALAVIAFGLDIESVNLPFVETSVELGWFSYPLTVLWIVGIANAVNLIDGLDGLCGGVSGIATASILVLALMMGNVTVGVLCAVLLGAIIGFLFFNFHPAKIFMGDSGALFLGFSLATLSILEFKQAALVTFLVPVFILGVPLSDTFFAILRRVVNKRPISAADKGHLHHCLLELGFSHRATVLIIYGISAFFGMTAIVLSHAGIWMTIIITVAVLFMITVGAEAIGIISRSRKPVLHMLRKIGVKFRGLLVREQ